MVLNLDMNIWNNAHNYGVYQGLKSQTHHLTVYTAQSLPFHNSRHILREKNDKSNSYQMHSKHYGRSYLMARMKQNKNNHQLVNLCPRFGSRSSSNFPQFRTQSPHKLDPILKTSQHRLLQVLEKSCKASKGCLQQALLSHQELDSP
jgi:hypothetical protein